MPATPLLAEDLLVLCWDDDAGTAQSRCSSALPAAVGGALLLDLVLAEAVVLDDDRVTVGDVAVNDPLLAAARADLVGKRRPPKTTAAVGRIGGTKRYRAVRGRLVERGVLRAERRRLLGLVPVTRYPLADPAATSVRRTVTELLTGARDPERAEPREVMLAALMKPTGGVDVLVAREERKAAKQRAEAFAEGHGVPAAVGEAVRQAQAAALAAATAAVAASAAASSSGGGGS